MPTKPLMKPCRTCEKATLHLQQVDSATPHLIMTVITGGLWLIVWALRETGTSVRSSPECTQRGGSTTGLLDRDLDNGQGVSFRKAVLFTVAILAVGVVLLAR